MSTQTRERRLNVRDLAAMKGSRPIVSLTAYSAPMARALDADTDMILVGDSLGMLVGASVGFVGASVGFSVGE